MVNPEMPNIPGMGSMTDTLEFVKKLWGGMGIPGTQPGGGAGMPGAQGMSVPGMNLPGMVIPTLSVEEINKKITDLKAVESWLALNMNMLRGTIQALEVQAATLTALNAMGQSVSATMKAAGMSAHQAAAPSSAPNGAAAAKAQGAAQPSAKDEQDAANLTAPLVNAAAWWNMLQDQFQQAVSNAMTGETPAAPQGEGAKTAAKPKTGAAPRKSKPPKE